MNEERMLILDMVANGKITVEEASQLLQALEHEDQVDPDELPIPRRPVTGPPASRAPTLDEIIKMQMHGVDADFIRDLKRVGLRNLTPDQLIHLYNHGVDAGFVVAMRGQGYTNLTVDELVHLMNHGVDPASIDELREAFAKD